MVSTCKSTREAARPTKFVEGERVLCFEPDIRKVKVLYDSKVVEVFEGKDKRGRRQLEYLIHFQGWSSTWDRRVTEDFILKDTEENRQLQRELAEKSQLQLGAYLYRKERKKRRKLSERIGGIMERQFRNNTISSEEGSSCEVDPQQQHHQPPPPPPHPIPQLPVNGFPPIDVDPETEDYYSSSVESMLDEERVYLQMGEILKNHLELDFNMINKEQKLANLPAKVPVITILEGFVRHYALKQICGLAQEAPKPKRRKSDAKYVNDRLKEFERLKTNIELCKEVADGLRIYFDFTVKDYLLYKDEKRQAEMYLCQDYLANLTYIATEQSIPTNINFKIEMPQTPFKDNLEGVESVPSTPGLTDRKLRSTKIEEPQENLSSVASNASSEGSGQANSLSSTMNILKSSLPLNIGISKSTKALLDEVYSWKLLPSNSPATPSMIYGAVHLTRLIIKLPDFLSASTLSDEKLKLLLKYLDCVSEYLEHHEEFFCQSYYKPVGEDEEMVGMFGSDLEKTPTKSYNYNSSDGN